MIYGYIRVSTDKQTIENQRFEIEKFCTSHHLKVDKWTAEVASGTIAPEDRRLGSLLGRLKADDMLICTELSRLGRSLFMIMDVLSACMKKDASLWTIKDNYRLGADLNSKVLAFAFGLSAEIERALISQRTCEALDRVRAEGKKLGRPVGAKNHQCKLDDAEETIIAMLDAHCSRVEIAKKLHVSRKTLYRFLAAHGLLNRP